MVFLLTSLKRNCEDFKERKANIVRRMRNCESINDMCHTLNRERDNLKSDSDVSVLCYVTLMLVISLFYIETVKYSNGSLAYRISKYVHKYWAWDLFACVTTTPILTAFLAAVFTYAMVFYSCIYSMHNQY